MSEANKHQVAGNHYLSCAIQPWDFIVSNGLPFLEGCIIKYVARHRRKGGIEDLKKAQHFLAKLIEEEEKAAAAKQPAAERECPFCKGKGKTVSWVGLMNKDGIEETCLYCRGTGCTTAETD